LSGIETLVAVGRWYFRGWKGKRGNARGKGGGWCLGQVEESEGRGEGKDWALFSWMERVLWEVQLGNSAEGGERLYLAERDKQNGRGERDQFVKSIISQLDTRRKQEKGFKKQKLIRRTDQDPQGIRPILIKGRVNTPSTTDRQRAAFCPSEKSESKKKKGGRPKAKGRKNAQPSTRITRREKFRES